MSKLEHALEEILIRLDGMAEQIGSLRFQLSSIEQVQDATDLHIREFLTRYPIL